LSLGWGDRGWACRTTATTRRAEELKIQTSARVPVTFTLCSGSSPPLFAGLDAAASPNPALPSSLQCGTKPDHSGGVYPAPGLDAFIHRASGGEGLSLCAAGLGEWHPPLKTCQSSVLQRLHDRFARADQPRHL